MPIDDGTWPSKQVIVFAAFFAALGGFVLGSGIAMPDETTWGDVTGEDEVVVPGPGGPKVAAIQTGLVYIALAFAVLWRQRRRYL